MNDDFSEDSDLPRRSFQSSQKKNSVKLHRPSSNNSINGNQKLARRATRANYSSEEDDSQDENECISFQPSNIAQPAEEIEEIKYVKRRTSSGLGRSWASGNQQESSSAAANGNSNSGTGFSIPIQGFKPKDLSGGDSARDRSARSQQSISTASDVEAFLNRDQIVVRRREDGRNRNSNAASTAETAAVSADSWTRAPKMSTADDNRTASAVIRTDAAGGDSRKETRRTGSWQTARPAAAASDASQPEFEDKQPQQKESSSPPQQQQQRQDDSADFDHCDIYADNDAVDMPQQHPQKMIINRSGHQHNEEDDDDDVEEIDGGAVNATRKHRSKKSQKHKKKKQQPPAEKFEAYAALRQQSELRQSPRRKSGRYHDDDSDNNGDFDGEQRTELQQQQHQLSLPPQQQMRASGPPPAVRSNAWTTAAESAPQQQQLTTTAVAAQYSFVHVAHPRGHRSEHVQCTVLRERGSMSEKLLPRYTLLLENGSRSSGGGVGKPLLVAQKKNLNRTSNYHIFDVTRGQLSRKLSKKSGNYIGKLRAKNMQRTDYVLLNQNSEKEELAGVRFDKATLVNQLKDGNMPRKMKIIVPKVQPIDLQLQQQQQQQLLLQGGSSSGDAMLTVGSCVPVPNRTSDGTAGSFAEKLQQFDKLLPRSRTSSRLTGGITSTTTATTSSSTAATAGAGVDYFVFESKDPVFENGNYRLNFNGRVSLPSVKNFQMVSRDDPNNIVCQFGKVDEDVFHLDFKAPVNACQAFAFALCQFNL